MKKLLTVLSISIMAALILAACGGNSSAGTSGSGNSQSQIEDIFTIPSTTAPQGGTPTTNPSTPGGTAGITPPDGGQDLGSFSHGFNESEIDHSGRFIYYDGGEAQLSYYAEGEGEALKHGIGVLMFLDGQPQPFRFSQDEPYQYMQYLDGSLFESREDILKTVYFTPVSGQVGDELEIHMLSILNPDYYPAGGLGGGFCYTTGALFTNTMRLKFNADAPAPDLPQLPDRIAACQMSFVDLTSEDIAGKSQEEINGTSYYRFSRVTEVSGPVESSFICNVTSSTQVELQFELFGCPDAEYGLVLFVDNEPVPVQDGQWLYVQSKRGQKCTVTITLQLPEFDGFSVLYAALVPRNSVELFSYADVFPEAFKTYYLTDVSDPKDIPDK